MKAEYLKLYSKMEQKRMQALDALFAEWKEVVGDKDGYWFIPDGFYPKYLGQKTRILYIGRDAYNIYESYIENFIRQYLAGRMDNGPNINRVKFHKMLIQVAYGLIHNCPWSSGTADGSFVPYASEICEGGKVFEQATFAFMNLCKWSHEYDQEKKQTWKADGAAINDFVNKSATEKRNFFLEEIELLDPHIIITMNFGPDLISRWTGNLAKSVDTKNENCFVYSLSSGNKERMIFDPWHFSSTRKSEERDIYNPLLKMTRKYCPR